MGITHLINAAQGSKFNQVNTTADDYKDTDLTFLGIPAIDVFKFKMTPYFKSSSDFIHTALQQNGMSIIYILVFSP